MKRTLLATTLALVTATTSPLVAQVGNLPKSPPSPTKPVASYTPAPLAEPGPDTKVLKSAGSMLVHGKTVEADLIGAGKKAPDLTITFSGPATKPDVTLTGTNGTVLAPLAYGDVQNYPRCKDRVQRQSAPAMTIPLFVGSYAIPQNPTPAQRAAFNSRPRLQRLFCIRTSEHRIAMISVHDAQEFIDSPHRVHVTVSIWN